MPRKKQETEDLEIFDQPDFDEIDSLISGLPAEDSIVRLYRVKQQGRPAFIQSFRPSEFDVDAIKESFGGGKYQLIITTAGQRRAAPINFEIEGNPKTVGSEPTYRRYNEQGKLVFLTKEERENVDRKSHIPNGIVPTIYLLMEEIKDLKKSLSSPVQVKDSRKEFLEELLMYKNLFAPTQQNTVQDFSKVAIDLIKQGMEVAATADNGGSPWMMIIDKVLPTIQDALKTVAIQQARQRGIETQPQIQKQELPMVDQPLNQESELSQLLKPYVPTFFMSAANNSDINLMVDLAIAHIPQDKIPVVIEWLQSPDWFKQLCNIEPRFSAQYGWWQDFGNILLQSLTNPQQQDGFEEG